MIYRLQASCNPRLPTITLRDVGRPEPIARSRADSCAYYNNIPYCVCLNNVCRSTVDVHERELFSSDGGLKKCPEGMSNSSGYIHERRLANCPTLGENVSVLDSDSRRLTFDQTSPHQLDERRAERVHRRNPQTLCHVGN